MTADQSEICGAYLDTDALTFAEICSIVNKKAIENHDSGDIFKKRGFIWLR